MEHSRNDADGGSKGSVPISRYGSDPQHRAIPSPGSSTEVRMHSLSSTASTAELTSAGV